MPSARGGRFMTSMDAKTIEVWQGLQFSRFFALRMAGSVQFFRVPDRWSTFFWDEQALKRALSWIADHYDELEDGEAIVISEPEMRLRKSGLI